MAESQLANVLKHLRRRVAGPMDETATDGQLLQRFVTSKEAAAFTELLHRHGPMVLGVCQRVLRNSHDAEDACQAAFLVLARKAASIQRQDSLAGWLYRVAFRLAIAARTVAAQQAQTRGAETMIPIAAQPKATDPELRRLVDEELQRLPKKFQVPLVLCYLEGKQYEEAAQLLGWSKSTFKGRLTQGREMLRKRLIQRGLVSSSTAFAITLTDNTLPAALPAAFVSSTANAALAIAGGSTAMAGVVSAPVAALTEGLLRAMLLSKVKAGLAALLVLGMALTAGYGVLAKVGWSEPEPATAKPTEPVVAQAAAQAKPEGNEKKRLDAYGDPLPPGALLRLGTVRFRHGTYLDSVNFSPDGKILASGSSNQCRLWDVATGKEILTVEQSGRGLAVAFSPDSKTVASASCDKTVRLLDISTGKQIRSWEHQAPLESVAFAPDGRSLATGSADTTIRLWDVRTGQQIRTFSGHTSLVRWVAFAADGKTLASGDSGQTIRLWDVATGKEIRAIETQGFVWSVAFAPDGKTLAATGEPDGGPPGPQVIWLWDAGTGKKIHTLTGHQECHSVAFAPDSKTLVSAGRFDKTIRLWDVGTGKEMRAITAQSEVWTVAFAPDGKTLASGDEAPMIRLWNVGTGKEIQTSREQEGAVRRSVYSPDGKTLASAGGAGNMIRLWDMATGKQIGSLTGHHGGVRSIAFSPDGKNLVSAGNRDGSFRLWDVGTFEAVRSVPGREETPYAVSVAFAPDGKPLACDWRDQTICLWDLGTGKEIRTVKVQRPIYSVRFAPDGKTLVCVFRDDTIGIWEINTGKEIQTLRGHQQTVFSVAFAPDGKTLATGSQDQTIRLWDVSTGKELRILTEKWGVAALAFAPDGKTLASAGSDGIRLWEVATGKEIRTLTGHQGLVGSVAFAPDGKSLVSGSSDSTMLVWPIFGGDLAPTNLTVTEMQELWTDLDTADAARAYRAVNALAAVPQRSVPFLQQLLPKPLPAPDPQRLARLIADLGSDQFAVRQQATQELEKLAELAEPALRQALNAQPALEMHGRLERLLEKAHALAPDQLRWLRAIQALELIGSAEVKPALEALAREAPAGRVRRDAAAALERLAKRSGGR